HSAQQLSTLVIIESHGDRHIPEPRGAERFASYGIFLRHEHGKIVVECQIRANERVVVGKGMLDDLDTPGAQIPKETLRITYSRHRVDAAPPKMLQQLRPSKPIDAVRLRTGQGHLQAVRQPGLPGRPQRFVLRNTVDDDYACALYT